jgi:hypothetical protein
MPTGLGRSPRVQKGAIVFYQLPDLLPNLIAFQCNPDEVIHSLQGRAAGGGGRGDADQINGPPEETFSFTVEIDATDQLEQPGQNALAVDAGFYPVIAALENCFIPRRTPRRGSQASRS